MLLKDATEGCLLSPLRHRHPTPVPVERPGPKTRILKVLSDWFPSTHEAGIVHAWRIDSEPKLLIKWQNNKTGLHTRERIRPHREDDPGIQESRIHQGIDFPSPVILRDYQTKSAQRCWPQDYASPVNSRGI